MRVGLIIYGDLDTISGGYLYDRQLVRYLQEQGDDVKIISLPWTGYGKHLLHNFDSALQRKLGDSSFDILLQDELNHPSLFWLNRDLKRRQTLPLVSIVHHLRSSEHHSRSMTVLYRQIEKRYLRSVDGFIFNSETTCSVVNALLREEKPHIVAYPAVDHIHPTTDRAAVIKRALTPGPLRLIFVGNIIPRKGCALLLKSLTNLPKGSWQLKMVGDMTVDPQYVRQMEFQVDTSGIAPYIQWHGRVSDSDLVSLLSVSHVLVVPSTYEGFGIVYLEGMRHALPAIAGSDGAAYEIISDGVNGYLVPTDDYMELARRLQLLIDNRQLLAQQSLAALDRAQQQPTWAETMARVRQFLISLISGAL